MYSTASSFDRVGPPAGFLLGAEVGLVLDLGKSPAGRAVGVRLAGDAFLGGDGQGLAAEVADLEDCFPEVHLAICLR